MDIKDIFWLSYRDLNEKKVRTILTIVMVIIGIAAIVALTSFTAGINNSITTQLESLGPTAIIVSSGTSTGFTEADVSKLSSLPNVTSVTPLITGSATLYAGNQNTSVTVIGVSTQGLSQLVGSNVTLYEGSLYLDTIAPDAVVGHSVAFPSSAAGQQTVTIGQSAVLKFGGRNGQTVTVPLLGILSAHGGSLIPVDTGVFVSVQAAGVLLHRSSFNEMLVLASNLSSVNATSSLITTIYGSSARILTTSQLLSTASSIIGSITLLFAVIAGVSLLVAAIGIMNIMLMAVMERTHEIGIMKAIGFKSKHVMLVFLLQALMIGLVGGISGIIVGATASYSLAAVFGSGTSSTTTSDASGAGGFRGGGGFGSAGGGGAAAGTTGSAVFAGGSSSGISFKPAFPLTTIATALLIAVIVSVAAGLYPAWRASRMEPIDALREL
ncbi:MAG: FtsX-like permease family protein [Candidatus Micrarchaeales archaeon]|jgi:putative ABC transport system permease protein